MIKKVILVLVLSMLPLSVFGASEKGVEIEFWTTDTQQDRIKVIELMADTFEVLTDNKVTVVPVAESEFAAQLAKASGANAMPVVIHSGSELLSSFGETGLVDRQATTSVIKSIGENKFYLGALKQLQAPDKSYNAVPLYGWVQGLWYRSDMFKKSKLNPPETWDDILVAAKHFNNPKEGFYGILIPSDLDQFSEQVFTQIALSNNAQMFNSKGELVFNSKQMVEALAFYTELAKYSPPGKQTWRARDYYIQNRMAMFPYSTFIMDDLALAESAANSLTSENFDGLKGASFDKNLVKNTKMVPVIKNKQSASYGQITGVAILKEKDTRKTEAAKEWIMFIEEKDNLISWGHSALGGANPAIKSVATSKDYLNDPRGVFVRYGRAKMSEIVSGMDNIQKFNVVDGKVYPEANIIFSKMIIAQMIQKTVLQGESPEKAVAWAHKEMAKIVSDYRK